MPDNDAGSSGNTDGSTSKTEREPRTELADRMIAKYGTASAALAVVVGENYDLRDWRRNAESTIAELKKSKPKDGAVVLSADDAKAFAEFQALGLNPADVRSGLTERDTLKGQVAETTLKDLAHDAAKAAGYTNGRVLFEQVKSRGLALSMKDETVNGATVRVPYVTPSGEGQQAVRLGEYVDRELSDYIPALRAGAGAASSNGNGRAGTGSGVPFPAQTGGGKAATGDVAADFIARVNEAGKSAPNPLVPRTAAAPNAR